MTERTARLNLGLVLPVAALLIGIVPYLALRSDLPPRLATHFGPDGVPDGSMTPGGFLAFSGVMFAVGALLCIGIGLWKRPLPPFTGLSIAALGGFFAGLAAGIVAETVVTQRELAAWTDASLSWLGLAFAIVMAVAFAAVAARLGSLLPELAPDPTVLEQPVMALAHGEHAVWSGAERNVALTIMAMVGVLVAVVLTVIASSWWLGVVMGISALAMVALSAIRVRADRTGLTVRYGPLPWPQTQLAVGEMSSASVIDVRPSQWGGWGYRGSLKLMKQAAVVMRAGPGIRIDLRNGKVFVVTIDNPEQAVALLNAEINRSQGALSR